MANILAAMKSHRLFERFGFNLPKTAMVKEGKITEVSDYNEWKYSSKLMDWFSEQTGEALSNYLPDIYLQNQLANNIDTQLQ